MATENAKKVAFIGIGTMGGSMASHLLKAGYQLSVYNRTPQKCDPLVKAGARLAASPADAAADADVVITMVGVPEDVEELYLSRGGLLDSSKPGAYLIDMTTSSPELARDIAEVAELSGRHAFDAPVTGGPEGAAAATLTVFCGATANDVAPVRDVLSCFGPRIFCFGEAGKGQMAKLANQTALAGAMLGLAEAVSFAKQGGLDVAQTLEALAGGMGDSKAMQVFGPKLLADDFAPGFAVDHYVKDLGLILSCAEGMELTLPCAETASQLYGILSAVGAGRMGTQSIALMYEDEAACAAHGLNWDDMPGEECGCGEEECGCGCGHDHRHHHAEEDLDDDDDYEEYDFAQAYGLESFYDVTQN